MCTQNSRCDMRGNLGFSDLSFVSRASVLRFPGSGFQFWLGFRALGLRFRIFMQEFDEEADFCRGGSELLTFIIPILASPSRVLTYSTYCSIR